jgi:hypothetical protein
MKKKILILAGVLGVLVLVAVVIAGMSLGKIMKAGVETVGPKITKTEMKLDSASFSLWSGSGTLKGFMLGNPEGYKTASAIKAGSVSVGVQPRSIFSDKVHVTHVRVEGPEITFEGTLGTANNLGKILENAQAATGGEKSKTESKPDAPAKKLQVDEFTITGAKVNLSMTMLGGKALTVPLPDIKLPPLGTGPEGITAGELTQQVLKLVTAETLKVAEKAVTDFGKNAAGAVTKGATETLDKATKGIGDLFKKK